MIAIVDYGAGNIFSVKNALDYLGVKCMLTNKTDEIKSADSIILPGVGAYPDAMEKLLQTGLVDTLKNEAKMKPFLGICLGMQLLFDESDEFSVTKGLSLISGKVKRIETEYKIPHMGWNELVIDNTDSKLMKDISNGDCVYFVHSFMADTDKSNITAHCEYGCDIPALVEKGYVYGTQFHPEKSGEVGLKILKNFCDLK